MKQDFFDQGLIKLGKWEAAFCKREPEAYVKALISCQSQRIILHYVYQTHVRAGILKGLSDQSEDVKRFYWEMAKKEAAGKLQKEDVIILSTIFYLLETLL